MKVKLPLRRLAMLNNTLYTLVQKNPKGNPRFMFAAKTNADRMRDMMKNADEQREAAKTPEYRKFLHQRDLIYSKHRQELGMKPGDFDFRERTHLVEQEVMELASSDEFRKPIDEYSSTMKEMETMFNEDVEIELKAIAIDALPKKMSMFDFVALEPIIEKAYEIPAHELTDITLPMTDLVAMLEYLTGIRRPTEEAQDVSSSAFPLAVSRRLGFFVKTVEPHYNDWMKVRGGHMAIPEFVAAQAKRNAVLADENLPMEEKVRKLNEVMSELPQEVHEKLAKVDAEIEEFGRSERTVKLSKIRLSDLPDDMSFVFMELFFALIDDEK